eukprot:TRINITY_DN107630_c0_g1_i1.p1 TRINITY_DN107630_c0_g1~~TRINITY_DN107630_c0_g1_i1.p1  ORF type:complete len:276 (-),score=60.95 TRINITY_DN107630_c0_g1_i1:28-855(-)
MGGDGGQVIDRATMVKTKGWGLTKSSGNRFAASLGEMNSYVQMVFEDRGLSSLEMHKARMTTCRISQQVLQEPVVACRLGNLYNKEALIGALLNRTMPEDVAHVRALKDVKQCIISWTEAENEDGLRRMVCPVTREDLDHGSSRAVVIWSSGAVISAKSVKEMKMKECPVTSKAFDPEKDVIALAPEGEELAKLRQQLPAPKKRKKEAQAATKAEAEAEEEEAPGESSKAKVSKTKDPTKESEVYKKLFTSDRQGLEGPRDAFGKPIYNRGSRVC